MTGYPCVKCKRFVFANPETVCYWCANPHGGPVVIVVPTRPTLELLRQQVVTEAYEKRKRQRRARRDAR